MSVWRVQHGVASRDLHFCFFPPTPAGFDRLARAHGLVIFCLLRYPASPPFGFVSWALVLLASWLHIEQTSGAMVRHVTDEDFRTSGNGVGIMRAHTSQMSREIDSIELRRDEVCVRGASKGFLDGVGWMEKKTP
jgi:hypothetical protein